MSDDAERPDHSAPADSPVPPAPESAPADSPVPPAPEQEHGRHDRDRDRQPPDADAWATACEEDLEAERARRRARYGTPQTSAADELRKLVDAVQEKVAEFGKPLAGAAATGAAQGVAQQLIAQAKASLEPVVERNPQLFDHLAAAGNELLAAYRAAVGEAERRWSEPQDVNGDDLAAGAEHIDLDRLDPDRPTPGQARTDRPDPDPIDLDKGDDPDQRGGSATGEA